MISDDLGNPTLPQTIIMIPTKTTPLVYIPVATRDVVGGVKIGDGLNIDADGTLSFDSEQITIKTISVNGVEVQPDENDNIDLKVVEPYPLDLVLGEGFNHFEHDGRPLTFDELVQVTQDPSKDVWLRIAPYEDDENCVVRLNRYGQSSRDIVFIGNVVSETILSRYYVSTGSHYQYGYAVFNNIIELETTSNRTVTIDRYSNTKYPTTKAVYDFVMEHSGGKVDDVLVNGTSVLSDDKIARVTVPTATSQLSNDGDGESPYATEIDIASVQQEVRQLNQMIFDTNNNVAQIEIKIPEQASIDNQLADKAFVNSTVQTNTANFRGNWTNWTNVPTNIEDYPEDYVGNHKPTVNDYMVVQNASDYEEETLVGTWRFKYTGNWDEVGVNGWRPEYQVNETPLTAAQLAALNSGITSGAVGQITTNQNNIETLSDGLQETDNKVTTLENDVDELKVLKLDANPTTETVGKVGQFALNVTSSELFQCVSVDEEGGVHTYTWQAVGGEGLPNTIKVGGTNEASIVGAVSIAIGNNAKTSSNLGVAIGHNSNASNDCISIGGSSKATAYGTVSIGGTASNISSYSTGLGYGAKTTDSHAIQIGYGTNTKADTLQIWNDNIYNHSTHTATFQNLSDGTTTKTMTEVLAGGGIPIREL